MSKVTIDLDVCPKGFEALKMDYINVCKAYCATRERIADYLFEWWGEMSADREWGDYPNWHVLTFKNARYLNDEEYDVPADKGEHKITVMQMIKCLNENLSFDEWLMQQKTPQEFIQ